MSNTSEVPEDVRDLAVRIVGTSANTEAERRLVERGILADRAARQAEPVARPKIGKELWADPVFARAGRTKVDPEPRPVNGADRSYLINVVFALAADTGIRDAAGKMHNDIIALQGMLLQLAAATQPEPAPVAGVGVKAEGLPNDADEAYEIGERDGYESAVQDLDLATGGDGEFKGSTLPGETVDVPVMRQRIIDRFAALTPVKPEPDLMAADALSRPSEEAERDRLAKLVEAHIDDYATTDEIGVTARVALAIAARDVRRGRALTKKEQLANFVRAMNEDPSNASR